MHVPHLPRHLLGTGYRVVGKFALPRSYLWSISLGAIWAIWACLALISILVSTQNAAYVNDNLHWGLALLQGYQFCEGWVAFKDHAVVRGYLDFAINCAIDVTLGRSFWAYALVYQIVFIFSQLLLASAARNFGVNWFICGISCVLHLIASNHLPYPWPDYIFAFWYSVLIFLFSLFPRENHRSSYTLSIAIAVVVFLCVLSRISSVPIMLLTCLIFSLYYREYFKETLVSLSTLFLLVISFVLFFYIVHDVTYSDILGNFQNVRRLFNGYVRSPLHQLQEFSVQGFLVPALAVLISSVFGLIYSAKPRIALFGLTLSVATLCHSIFAHLPDYFRFQLFTLGLLIGLIVLLRDAWFTILNSSMEQSRRVGAMCIILMAILIPRFHDTITNAGRSGLNLEIEMDTESVFQALPEFRQFGKFISSTPSLFSHQEQLLGYCKNADGVANFTVDSTATLICANAVILVENTLAETLANSSRSNLKNSDTDNLATIITLVPSGSLVPTEFITSLKFPAEITLLSTVNLSTDDDPYILSPFSQTDIYLVKALDSKSG